MIALSVAGVLLALGAVAYMVVALVKPEWFS